MSLSAVPNYLPPAGLLAHNVAQTYVQKPAHMAVESNKQNDNFASELARTKIEQASLDGKPIALASKSQLASKRSVPVQTADPTQLAPSSQASNAPSAQEAAPAEKKDSDGYDFWDLVDLVNPLQHLPVIGTIYRNVTGDEIKPEVQIAGSVLLGAATGSIVVSALTGIASTIFEENMGEDPLTMVADALLGDEEEKIDPNAAGSEKIMVADAEHINPQKPASDALSSGVQTLAALPPDVQKMIDQAHAEDAKATAAALLKEQEHVQRMSNPQSPEFVREFMMQALDKYRVAHSQGYGAAPSQPVVR